MKQSEKKANLKHFLDTVELLKITRNGKSLVVAKYQGVVSFHIAGESENEKRRECQFISPNAVAQTCRDIGFEAQSQDIVRISDFC